jgi:hypothetical protein
MKAVQPKSTAVRWRMEARHALPEEMTLIMMFPEFEIQTFRLDEPQGSSSGANRDPGSTRSLLWPYPRARRTADRPLIGLRAINWINLIQYCKIPCFVNSPGKSKGTLTAAFQSP